MPANRRNYVVVIYRKKETWCPYYISNVFHDDGNNYDSLTAHVSVDTTCEPVSAMIFASRRIACMYAKPYRKQGFRTKIVRV